MEIIFGLFFGLVVGLVGLIFILKLVGRIFHPRTIGIPAQTKEMKPVETVTVCQFNPQWGIGSSIEGVSQILHYDILVLTQVPSVIGSPLNSFIKLCVQNGFKCVCPFQPAPVTSTAFFSGGVVVLSKLPITESDCYQFQLSIGKDMFLHKGILYTKVNISETHYFHLFSTLFQDSNSGTPAEARTIHNCECRELGKFMKFKLADGQPAVVAGNFFIDANSEESSSRQSTSEYNYLMKNLSLENYEVEDAAYSSLGKHPVTCNNGKSIDYIILERTRAVESQSTSILPLNAPHNAVVTQIKFTTKESI